MGNLYLGLIKNLKVIASPWGGSPMTDNAINTEIIDSYLKSVKEDLSNSSIHLLNSQKLKKVVGDSDTEMLQSYLSPASDSSEKYLLDKLEKSFNTLYDPLMFAKDFSDQDKATGIYDALSSLTAPGRNEFVKSISVTNPELKRCLFLLDISI